ncbi:hypothetical protein INR49_011216 [Caranx melampygus]|nr:hypothetical protein INR49_011216 [Caranx melampygus]
MTVTAAQGRWREQGKSKERHRERKAKKKKKKSNEHEALEDSDDGDYEGLEVDYMSDEAAQMKSQKRGTQQRRGLPKGIDEASESEEESEEEKQNDEETRRRKKRRKEKNPGPNGKEEEKRTGSRPGTPSIDSAATSNTLRAAASKLEQGKRQTQGLALIHQLPKG